MFRNIPGRSDDAVAFRSTFQHAVGPGYAAATINETTLRLLTEASRTANHRR